MWATFIGSTLVHSPVPAERKSGMPDGTETPAPVSATTDSACSISPASRPAADCGSVIRPTSHRRTSKRGESRQYAAHVAETLPEDVKPYPGISSKAYE